MELTDLGEEYSTVILKHYDCQRTEQQAQKDTVKNLMP